MQVNRIMPYKVPKINFKASKESENKTKYPNDELYRKTLAQAVNLKPDEAYKLSSIIGQEELSELLRNAKRQYFNPSDIVVEVMDDEKADKLANRGYSFNLHIHTTASDGVMTPVELLDKASSYADRLHDIDPNKSFTIAITDHDTMNGAKQIVKEVTSNPEKYKNLKIVLGVELSALYRDKNSLDRPLSYELLGYCVNPFDNNAQSYLNQLRLTRVGLAENIILNAYKQHPEYNFSYDEACQYSKNPKKGIDGFLYSLADYFKSKAPDKGIEQLALQYVPKNKEEKPVLCYEAPVIKEAFKNAGGFFALAHPGRIHLKGRINDEFIRTAENEGKKPEHEVINGFIRNLKSVFEEKFCAMETNYQGYSGSLRHASNILSADEEYDEKYKNAFNWLAFFRDIAQKNDFLETGGLDTHSQNPFLRG